MGRRYIGLSPTTINRIAQRTRQARRDRERQALLRTSGGEKEGPTTVEIQTVDFDKASRIARITFIEKKNYRTVDRYVTQNYVRYPILSEWKTKRKIITKTIKLTNDNLESLNFNSDKYISNNAFDIIYTLQDEELYPRWYLLRIAEADRKSKIEELESKFKKETAAYEYKCSRLRRDIDDKKQLLSPVQRKLEKKQEKKAQKTNYLERIKENALPIYAVVLTVGICKLLRLIKRKSALKCTSKLTIKISELQKECNRYEQIISSFEQERAEATKQHKSVKKNYEAECKKVNAEHEDMISQIPELEKTLSGNVDFTPMSKLVQFDYTKIIGCYVIRNTHNKKCYVGQSKDVIRRLKQHFNGTTPANIIFSEDYYTCPEAQREALFEFAVFECHTKDELDLKERELIIEYEARISGYNRTAGNT